jgi:hypothetical protein
LVDEVESIHSRVFVQPRESGEAKELDNYSDDRKPCENVVQNPFCLEAPCSGNVTLEYSPANK